MKFVAIMIAVLPMTLVAQSSYLREFKTMTEKRDRDLEAAAKQVNRGYQAELEKLLARATKNKDFEAIAAIAAALKEMGVEGGDTATGSSSALTQEKRIEDLLTSKVWVHRNQFHYRFTKNGRVHYDEGNRSGRYQIDGKSGFVTFYWDRNEFAGEGIQLNKATQTFDHNKGGSFLPVSK